METENDDEVVWLPLPAVAVSVPLVVPGLIKTLAVHVALETIIAAVPLIVALDRVERSKPVPVIVTKVPTGPLVGLIEILGVPDVHELLAVVDGESFGAELFPDLDQAPARSSPVSTKLWISVIFAFMSWLPAPLTCPVKLYVGAFRRKGLSVAQD